MACFPKEKQLTLDDQDDVVQHALQKWFCNNVYNEQIFTY